MNRPLRDPICGCDAPALTKELISVETAFARLAETVTPLGATQTLPLAHASGRVLAAPVRTRTALPPFDNAAMDGYALRCADLVGPGPWILPVLERIAAGQPARGSAEAGAVQVFTGAPVPESADTVIMQEAVARSGEAITLTERPKPGAHLRRAGEIAPEGALLVAAGRRLGPRSLAAIAAAGHGEVTVTRPVRAALVITGDEICRPEDTPDTAGIWDVNGPLFEAALTEAGAQVTLHYAPDDRDATQVLLAGLADHVDLIVTTGGISVGEEDHVRPAMAALGAQISFAGVAIKPGKPVCHGRLKGAHWLGLPGNPVSAFVTWTLFGRYIMTGLQNTERTTKPATRVMSDTALRHRAGRAEYRLARIDRSQPGPPMTVICPTTRASGHITWLAQANGLICIPAQTGDIPAGTDLAFLPFGQPD